MTNSTTTNFRQLVLVVVFLFSLPSFGDGSREYENAKTVARIFQDLTQGKAICKAKRASKSILCIVNASDSVADQLAMGIVLTVNAEGIALSDWKLILVTHNDYVIRQWF